MDILTPVFGDFKNKKWLLKLSFNQKSMALMCRQIIGSGASSVGWVGLIVATATNDWVRTCDYSLAACLRMDELVSKGLWAECIVSTALYHCGAREQILTLPGETPPPAQQEGPSEGREGSPAAFISLILTSVCRLDQLSEKRSF